MRESERAQLGTSGPAYYADALKEAQRQREVEAGLKTVVKSEEMVWEDSPQGRIKHMVNGQMGTKEHCVDMYQQLIKPNGKSGKHRHMSEEVFYVLEGHGYDLHWDVAFDAGVAYEWGWDEEPKRFEWAEGDFVYIPPYTIHQHCAGSGGQARLLVANSRILKAMGLDWFEQLEDASD